MLENILKWWAIGAMIMLVIFFALNCARPFTKPKTAAAHCATLWPLFLPLTVIYFIYYSIKSLKTALRRDERIRYNRQQRRALRSANKKRR